MQQILLSITTKDQPSEYAVRALAMLAGQNLRHYGHEVHMVTAAQSPIAVDPRKLGLNDVLVNLTVTQKKYLMVHFPSLWLAVTLLNGTNEEKHDVPTPQQPAPPA